MPRNPPSAPDGPQDSIGARGEDLFRVKLTDYRLFPEPLFKLAFLGEKWEATDFLVELRTLGDYRPYFLAQIKSTSKPLPPNAGHLKVGVTRKDIVRLLATPGPTYLFGVHVPNERVFVKAIHPGMPRRPLGNISLLYELTPANLQRLHDEVRAFWDGTAHKPTASAFS